MSGFLRFEVVVGSREESSQLISRAAESRAQVWFSLIGLLILLSKDFC